MQVPYSRKLNFLRFLTSDELANRVDLDPHATLRERAMAERLRGMDAITQDYDELEHEAADDLRKAEEAHEATLAELEEDHFATVAALEAEVCAAEEEVHELREEILVLHGLIAELENTPPLKG